MCRIAGYLGQPLPLSALLASPPHSLRDQAKLPRELPPGVIGSDGFGVGWFAAEEPLPARYRSLLPIWVDENIDTFADHIRSSAIVASSRTASRRMPVSVANTPPFCAGSSLLAHNGEIENFPRSALELIRRELSEAARADILGNTDTEYLAALLRDRREARLVDRLIGTLDVVKRSVEAARSSAQLNLIVATAHELVVLRHSIGAAAPSLYVKHSASGLLAASEPMDDAADWRALNPGDMVIATDVAHTVTIEWTRIETCGARAPAPLG
jgi:glutamine amidotransferase